MKFMIAAEKFEKDRQKISFAVTLVASHSPDTSNIYSPASLSSVFARKIEIFFLFTRGKLALD